MRPLIVVLSLLSCAAVNPYAHDEAGSCPSPMTEEQHRSGVVRCTALCSSRASNFDSFDEACKCWCSPSFQGGYRPRAR